MGAEYMGSRERSAHSQKHHSALRDQVGLRRAIVVLPFFSGIMHSDDARFSACCIIGAPPVQASTAAVLPRESPNSSLRPQLFLDELYGRRRPVFQCREAIDQ